MSYFAETNFPTCEKPISGIETLLRMVLEELMKQNAADGMMIVNDEYEGTFYGVIAREDTVINQLMVDGEYVQDDYELTGETVGTSDPAIMAPKDEVFEYIKLTSGSVWVLLKL